LYNITALNIGNNNYSSSSETWWVRVTISPTEIEIYLNENKINTSDLFAYYPFDANYSNHSEADIIRDYSLNQFNGTGGGNISNGTPDWTDEGYFDGAYNFSRADSDVITLPRGVFFMNNSNYTIELWVKFNKSWYPQAANSNHGLTLFSKYRQWDVGLIFYNSIFGPSNITCIFSKGRTSDALCTNINCVGNNSWHQIVVVRDDAGYHFYYDGVAKGSTPSGGIDKNMDNETAYIGALKTTTALGHHYDGLMDEFTIYDEALTAARVAEEYNEKFRELSFGDNINLTIYVTNGSSVLFINDINETPAFEGLLQVEDYIIEAIGLGNVNYSNSKSKSLMKINKQNTSVALYINNIRGDVSKCCTRKLVNFTVYLFNHSSALLPYDVSFWNNFSGDWVQYQSGLPPLLNLTNVSGLDAKAYLAGGRWDGGVNYSMAAENWTVGIPEYNLTVNFSCGIPNFTYSGLVITNNTATAIAPIGQNNSCGIYNVTLEEEGSTSVGRLLIRLNATVNNVTIKMGNHSNYSNSISLSASNTEVYYNLTRGISKMVWHWMDLNSPPPGKSIQYNLIFEVRA
jgi:hypothetical protein